jgi:hypothetical protein
MDYGWTDRSIDFDVKMCVSIYVYFLLFNFFHLKNVILLYMSPVHEISKGIKRRPEGLGRPCPS